MPEVGGNLVLPTITIKGYDPSNVTLDDEMANPPFPVSGALDEAYQDLLVDQVKYISVALPVGSFDSSEESKEKVELFWGVAADSLALYSEVFIAGTLEANVPGGNKIGTTQTPKIPTKADAFEYLADLRALLDVAKAPVEDRFCVVPPWFLAMLTASAS